MEDIIERMNRMETEMSSLREENSRLKSEKAQSEGTQTDAVSKISARSNETGSRGTSLLSGMPCYHGIGAGSLSAAEELAFDKWHRRTEKSLNGSRVKVFNGTGWITWKQMILRDIVLNSLDATLLTHRTQDEVENMSPYLRKIYVTGDILLCGFLEAKLDSRAQNRIAASPTAALKWSKLEESYAKSSVAAQNLLTAQWNGLKQMQGQSIDRYIEKIDYTALEMAAAGIPPTEQSKLYTLLAGAGSEWATEIKILRRTRADYTESCVILLESGAEAVGLSQERAAEQASAAYASYGGRGRGADRGRGRSGGRGQGRGADLPFACYVCGSKDHNKWSCPTGLKQSVDSNGGFIPRCFNCLAEGHTSRQCKEEARAWGTFKQGEVRASGGAGTQGTTQDQA
jgi:hypothetical protein